jgi:starch synthase
MSSLSIVHIASELAPLVKVGGLADMVGGLAHEQASRGHRVLVAIPQYPFVDLPSGRSRCPLGEVEVPWGMGRERAAFELVEPSGPGVRVLLVRHAGPRAFYGRPGVYDDPATGEGYADNAERFLFFARAALEGLKRLGERFDILHAHDQQGAWAPCFVRTHEAFEPAFGRVATVFSAHNLGYQGIHDSWVLALAGFPGDLFYPGSVFEFWGRVNFMKVGLAFADMLTTVSPRHAREIQSSGEFGFGLEGLLSRRSNDLRGILNGIDEAWNPASDPWIARRFDAASLEGKAACRAALVRECGFPESPDWPLVGMVSRLVEQKGFDLVEQAGADLAGLEARFVVMGQGQPRYVEALARLEREHPDRFRFHRGRDDPLAHRIEAGCDLFLMPSRYEPCGLNQMYSQRYGTVPVVHAVGGLADTVESFDPLTGRGTGFRFERFEAAEMLAALRHALVLRRQPELWSQLQRNGMSRNFSWREPAEAYDGVYAEARARISAGRVPSLASVRASLEVGRR